MSEPLSSEIVRKANESNGLYYHLTLVVAPPGSGKSRVLREVTERMGASLINIGAELSTKLIDWTERQRAVKVPRLLDEIVGLSGKDVVLFDNIELLFDASLKLDPLRLLQTISRNKTVIAAWSGSLDKGNLIYAQPGHPEFRKYRVQDFLVVGLMGTA